MPKNLLKKLINFPSITPNDAGIFAFLREILHDFTALDLSAPADVRGENATQNWLFYKNFHPDPKTAPKNASHLCFCGHVDVVPPGDSWDHDAFIAREENGKIFGRGAQDMKGGVSAMITALQRAAHTTAPDPKILSLLLTSDEEGDGTFGVKWALQTLVRDFPALVPDFAIVAEPTCEKIFGDKIKIGRRGSINGVIEIPGVQGHAAYPQKCVNPIEILGSRLGDLAGNHLDSGVKFANGGGFAPSKFVITDIRAGMEVSNVTPSLLKIMFNVRNNPNVSVADVETYVENALSGVEYHMKVTQSSEGFLSDIDSSILKILTHEILAHTDTHPALDTSGGTSDARFFAKHKIPVVEFGTRNDRMHAVNEAVEISDVENLAEIFTNVAKIFLQKKPLDPKKSCDFVENFDGVRALLGKKIVILGFGSQGQSQAQNLRDSGLFVAIALPKKSIKNRSQSFKNAISQGFLVDTPENLLPDAFLVLNLTPDKNHREIVSNAVRIMPSGSFLAYAHGLNISEQKMQIPPHITPILCAPKGPGDAVRSGFLEGRGVISLIFSENDAGLEIAKSWACAMKSDKNFVLKTSFFAETKTDLMGEQTALCGLLQAAMPMVLEKICADPKIDPKTAKIFVKNAFFNMAVRLKSGAKNLFDRFLPAENAEIMAFIEIFWDKFAPLYKKHMDEILSGKFYDKIQRNDGTYEELRTFFAQNFFDVTPEDPAPDSKKLQNLAKNYEKIIAAILFSGSALCFETMVNAGFDAKNAYIESVYELPAIVELCADGLCAMNEKISHTAEFGSYVFAREGQEILRGILNDLDKILGSSVKNVQNLDLVREIDKIGLLFRG